MYTFLMFPYTKQSKRTCASSSTFSQRERERKGERQRQRDRDRERQRETETQTETDRDRNRETDIQTETEADRDSDRDRMIFAASIKGVWKQRHHGAYRPEREKRYPRNSFRSISVLFVVNV